jgi:hypothetical protein
LSEAEIQVLIGRYKVSDGTGMINYAAFLSKLNAVFSDTMNPSETIQNVKAQAVSCDSIVTNRFYRFSLMRRKTQ